VKSKIFYCYSPALSEFLQRKDIEYLGVGLNVNNGDKFWQFERGEELDAAIAEWQRNNPNKSRS